VHFYGEGKLHCGYRQLHSGYVYSLFYISTSILPKCDILFSCANKLLIDKWDETSFGNLDTMLWPVDISVDARYILSFAPVEGNSPINIFLDKFAGELSFSTIFCGEKRPSNSERTISIYFSDNCKSEERRQDRRVASCIPIFFLSTK
jgi:hypothetical protein